MRSPLPRILLMLTLIAFAHPGLCQKSDLKPLLAGTSNIPLTMKLGDLNGDWRRMSVGQPVDLNGVTRFYSSFLAGGPDDVYYTKGDQVTVGADQYLVAYHAPAQKLDLAALFKSGASGTPQMPKPVKLTADTVLSLSLLNLHTISSLSDIRPFDMTQEIAESDSNGGILGAIAGVAGDAQDNAVAASSESNLKQLGLAMVQYEQDYDEMMPPMKDAATAKKALYPYVKSDDVFLSPKTHEPYLPNTSLSHRSLASFNSPASMVIYYEASPAPDNTRAVCFLDGHVKRVPEAEWPSLKAASHVPNATALPSLPPGDQ